MRDGSNMHWIVSGDHGGYVDGWICDDCGWIEAFEPRTMEAVRAGYKWEAHECIESVSLADVVLATPDERTVLEGIESLLASDRERATRLWSTGPAKGYRL